MVVLVIMASVSYFSLNELIRNARMVSHTQAVIGRLEKMISLLKDAETGQRGYLLTGDEQFLEPLTVSHPQVTLIYRELDSLISDNPRRQQQLDTLQAIVAERYEGIATQVALVQAGRDYDVALLKRGNQLMNEARSRVNRMRDEEYTLLQQRQSSVGRYANYTPWSIIIFSSVAIWVAVVAYHLVWEDLKQMKAAEVEVSRNRALLQGILDISVNGIMVCKSVRNQQNEIEDFELILLNPAAERMAAKAAPVIGKRLSDMMAGGRKHFLFSQYLSVAVTGKEFTTEFFSPTLEKWFHLFTVKFEDGIFITFYDITERKASEEKLARSEALLKDSQSLAHVGSYEWDVVHDTITWSEEHYRIFGYEPGADLKLSYPTVEQMYHPDDRPMVKQAIADALNNTHPFNCEFRVRRPDGDERYVWSTARVDVNREGEPYRLVGTIVDITERKQAEQEVRSKNLELVRTLEELTKAEEQLIELNNGLEQRVQRRTRELKASEERYRFLAESIPAIVWTANPDGAMDYYNQQWTDYTGRPLTESVQWGWLESLHPDDRQRTLDSWQQAIRHECGYDVEHRIRRRDGNYCWFRTRAVAFRDSDGQLSKWFGTTFDINDQKRALEDLQAYQARLSKTNEELRRTNVDLDNFVYTASHDLRAPIANLEAIYDRLSRRLSDRLNESEQTLISLAENSVTRLKQTIGDLTEISRIQKLSDLTSEQVDLNQLIHEVQMDLYGLISQSGARITTRLDVTHIYYPKKDIRSIIYNLLSNAIKYRSPERRASIRLCTRSEGKDVVITVSDNGLGIADEQKHKLFAMFRRLHTHVEGSGIGLYIVKRIVENHGGEITVDSVLNQGSVFTVCIRQ
jgi:PAS domain S-box-containing protein